MYIRKTTKSHKGKTYTNYLLVESVATPKGPRQRIICSLGSLAPAPPDQWLDLARRLEASLHGQSSLTPADPQLAALTEKVRRARDSGAKPSRPAAAGPTLAIATEQVTVATQSRSEEIRGSHQAPAEGP